MFVRAHTDTKTDTETDTDTDEGTEGDTVDVSNVQHTISDNIPKSGCPHGSKSRDLSRDVEIDIHRGRAGDTVCTVWSMCVGVCVGCRFVCLCVHVLDFEVTRLGVCTGVR